MKKALSFFLLLNCITALKAQQLIQHTTNTNNTSANSTYLNVEGLNNNPNAIIIVENDAATSSSFSHAIGVWFNGNKWAIFNQDKATMPIGQTLNVRWKNADANAFIHKANNGNGQLDHPLLNGNSSAAFYVSQIWNPQSTRGVYNNSTISVSYNNQIAKWEIKNQNGTTLPEGCAFNVLITSSVASTISTIPNTNSVISNGQNNTSNSLSNATTLVQSIKDANLDFENSFLNWSVTGTAFNNQPMNGHALTTDKVLKHMNYNAGGIGGDYWKGMSYPIGFKGANWISSAQNTDAAIGAMTSLSIRATGKFLCFLLSGGSDLNKLYVELQVKKSDWEMAWGGPHKVLWGETEDGFVIVNRVTPAVNGEDLFRYYFDLAAALNQQHLQKIIRIKIVDTKTTDGGHINVDDFIFKESLDGFITLTKNGSTLLADIDKPVWGFADIHAHWMNHVGLNGFLHGTPGGKLETSDVTKDIPPCDGFNHHLPTITPGLFLAIVENKAFNRWSERLADPGNATCISSTLASGILFPVSGLTTAATVGVSALLGTIGQLASKAQARTGALDGTITGAVWGFSANPAFQACGYQFTKDVFAKHYGNNYPADQPLVSNYVDFPAWNSFAHQTMHISWVRRSYDGGQRLMVVPVGVAKSWEFNITTDGAMKPPFQHIQNAIKALEELVRLNNSWLQIAYTATEARKIILENKMAIIIGLEQAEIGNYYPNTQEEITALYNLGIRHYFPVHNINNKIGGAAIFNSALNSYNDLVNRISADDFITAFKVKEGKTNDETSVSVKLDRNFMRQNMRLIPIAGFGTIPFFYMNDIPATYNYEAYTAHKNAESLSRKGEQYLKALLKKGVIIDIDHMSDATQNEAVNMMQRYHYPFVSGHTNFRDLRYDIQETAGDNQPRLKTEFTIFNSRATDIINSGGMFGLMNQTNNINPAPGCKIDNNSAGGTSSFIQAYWYALQKGGENHGIAFGSDFNGFAPQVAPRFGTEAIYFLEGDSKLNIKIGNNDYETQRRVFAFNQKKGVKYDKPVSNHHYHRFQPTPFLTQEERDIWEAIAISKSNTWPADAWQPGGGISVERTGVQQDKIKNIAEGLRWGYQRAPEGDYGQFLECPDYVVRDENLNNCMPERKAAYMAVRGLNSLPTHMKTPRTIELHKVIERIYNLWLEFENGPNEPLRRSYAYKSVRDFDFNLDGQAHYGMYPDLIQDMKNLGLSPSQLKPLFLAAEQYIKMWEKAEAAKNNIND
jgi:microsomal dipeptidase-like Zn-dependent dipeptidase